MKRILTSLLTVLTISVLAYTATRAVWSDTGASNGNTFQAGTLDLQLSDSDETNLDNVSLTWNGTLMTPGGSEVLAVLNVRNHGNAAADHIHFDITSNVITEGNGVGADATSPMDKNLEITTLAYDGQNILSLSFLTDKNENGWIDLDDWELTAAPGIGDSDGNLVTDGTLPLTDIDVNHTLLMGVRLHNSSSDANQGDTVTTVLTATLHQAEGQ